ncbi:MAG: indole-3-glycerol phosphate synthase TrpC [Prevotella sp.]|nr:indole-3-glycerol phosphate synthase TrpC [Prevotella sp.]
MADILEEIVAYKKTEIEGFKKELSQVFLESRVEVLKNAIVPSMKDALLKSDTGIIAEFKRKSPSKGWINEAASATEVPISYQRNGAAAISILADSHFFGGSNAFLRTAIATKVRIPVLYKNFIIDEYQIYQAKVCGASAILLIAACLTKDQCRQFIAKAHEMELEVLLEMHNEEETEYAELEPDMYGINNRNLGTFDTDVNNSYQLVGRLPANGVKVSESGISDPDTIRQLRACGYQGFLIGETFMKEADPGLALKNFIAQL